MTFVRAQHAELAKTLTIVKTSVTIAGVFSATSERTQTDDSYVFEESDAEFAALTSLFNADSQTVPAERDAVTVDSVKYYITAITTTPHGMTLLSLMRST